MMALAHLAWWTLPSTVGAIIAIGATRAAGSRTVAGSALVLATLLVCAATTGVVSAVAETARTARTSGIIRLAFDIFVFMCRVLLTALQARGPPDLSLIHISEPTRPY